LFKRGGRWWTYFYLEGIRHQESTGTNNRRLAERIAQQIRDDALLDRHHLPTVDPNMTFDRLAALFIANAGATPHHLTRFTHLLPYFGDRPLRSITKATVREYREARHRAKTVTDATINRDVSVLRHLLYWATDEGYLTQNPLTRLRLAPERRTPRPVVTLAEEAVLLAYPRRHLRELIVMALDTGMRRGELLHQRWEQVDLDRQVLQVTRSKTIQGEGREIPLTARVHQLLESRRREEGLLFTYGKHRIGTIKTGWRTAAEPVRRHLRFHDLRHTFNTRLLEAGVLQEVRKALMGHTSGQGVHGVYTHIELPLKREAIARLERWLLDERTRLPSQSTTTSTTTSQEAQ
jgi:integrase